MSPIKDEASTDGDNPQVELVRLLAQKGVPANSDVLRVKRLIDNLAPQDDAGREVREKFVSAYFDLYLGRISGEPSLEEDALRRCLQQLVRVAGRPEMS